MFRRVRELIGGARNRMNMVLSRIWSTRPTADWSRVDYAYWDKASRGQAQGLLIAGMLIKPISSKIAAWVLGRAPVLSLPDPDRTTALQTWWTSVQAVILRAYEKSGGLGDMFVVLNGDGTVTALPPNVVHPMVDDNDWSVLTGWKVIQAHPHPDRPGQSMIIEDEYTAQTRVRTVRRGSTVVRRETFRHGLGRIPVVHIPNEPGADERFGHPELEGALNMLIRYDECLQTALDGNRKQGRPQPVLQKFATAKEIDDFLAMYGESVATELPDGTTETNYTLDLSSDDAILLSGNAEFKLESPGSFAGDTQILLQILYYLLIEYTEIPEFILGSAIQGSKASAETQMDPMVKFIEKRQSNIGAWVLEIALLGMAWLGLTQPALRTSETPDIAWLPLVDKDGQLRKDVVEWSYSVGLIDDETALRLLPVDFGDLSEVLTGAEKRRREDGTSFDEAMQNDLQDQTQQQMAEQLRDLAAAIARLEQAPARSNGHKNGHKVAA